MNAWMKLQNGSDVRGVAVDGVDGEPLNLTDGILRSIGFAFAQWLAEKKNKPADSLSVAVGHDSRISAQRVKQAVFEGMTKASVTIADCGLASTPAMFMSTIFPQHGCDGAIMLTASHLPYNRNGLKFFTAEGGLGKADITAILELAATCGELPEQSGVKATPCDLISDYAAELVNIIRSKADASDQPLDGLNIIVDAGNGAGGFFVEKVLKPLGADTTGSQFLDPDGNFPNHIPNPEDPYAMDAIISAVEKNEADFGIIFDTDVDRAGAVDRNGKPINRNRFIALMATIVLEEHPDSTIVTDSVTSTGLKFWIEEKLGGVHHRFKRGYKNVINESIRLNEAGQPSFLALETSGHGALQENYFLDDGAYQIAKILIKIARLKKENGPTVDELICELPEPAEAAEFRAKILCDDFSSLGDDVLEQLKEFVEKETGWSLTPNNYEGVHICCDAENGNGWALLRKSLHDPVLPLNIESEDVGGISIIAKRLRSFLETFSDLELPTNL